ncbi:MAG: glutamate-5-semialdehyde dehydrogenase [Clostridium sp.]|nr:glutamate-5-semialdehyde dehydrogenase [Clostridium sp.]
MSLNEMVRSVKKASIPLAAAGTELKNNALAMISKALIDRKDEILKANALDLKRSNDEGLAAPLLKRLKFDGTKIADVTDGINSLIGLKDPVGKTLLATELDEGLELYRITCPIGVIGVIFESRPDALVQISTLCLKSGNGVLLKGGSEARETNRILVDIISKASIEAGLPPNWIGLLETRSDVAQMLKLDPYIDLIIPRGSNEFVRYIMDNSRIPVMGHADGICHCYIDENPDNDVAIRVVVDSKTQYVAVCNAIETLIVHRDAAQGILPGLAKILTEKGVKLLGCPETLKIIPVESAQEQDWQTEYLDYKLAIKIVGDIDQAIEHINNYGSGHTDCIITRDKDRATHFMSLVDSGNVFWNCSTRFSDGFRYGFGAEVGISTNKIHARGPVGLDGLLIYKYKLFGNGHIVDDYSSRRKVFKHKDIKS